MLDPVEAGPVHEPEPAVHGGARNPGLVTGALALAALAVGAVGLLALRKRV